MSLARSSLARVAFIVSYTAICAAFALGFQGCAAASGPAPVQILKQDVPVAISCVPADLPSPPVYPDDLAALLAASSAVERAKLVEAGWGLRAGRLVLLEGVVAACK